MLRRVSAAGDVFRSSIFGSHTGWFWLSSIRFVRLVGVIAAKHRARVGRGLRSYPINALGLNPRACVARDSFRTKGWDKMSLCLRIHPHLQPGRLSIHHAFNLASCGLLRSPQLGS
jgi:hypothetical protein